MTHRIHSNWNKAYEYEILTGFESRYSDHHTESGCGFAFQALFVCFHKRYEAKEPESLAPMIRLSVWTQFCVSGSFFCTERF